MKSIICVLLILTVFAVFAMEEDQKSYRDFNEALGFQYGTISGTGISYYKMLDKFAIQIAGGIVYFPQVPDLWPYGTQLDYMIGVEFQFEVFGADVTEWLASQVYSFIGISHRGYIENESAGLFTPVFNLGAGIGIELIYFRHLSIPIELGYTLSWMPLRSNTFPDQIDIGLRPQAAFRYRF